MIDPTKQAYEDPKVIANFVKFNSLPQKQRQKIESEFIPLLPKKASVLDLGCGPGQDADMIADHEMEVIGLDYSKEMIATAKKLYGSKANFIVGDMRNLDEYFRENQFDAIWASASLIHIKKEDIEKVLKSIVKICKNNGLVYISLKRGGSTILYEDDKYGKKIKREFVLWEKDEFLRETQKYNLIIEKYFLETSNTMFRGEKTPWLNFFFRVKKN